MSDKANVSFGVIVEEICVNLEVSFLHLIKFNFNLFYRSTFVLSVIIFFLVYWFDHATDFFWKYVASILMNSDSIDLFNDCKFTASDFTLFNSYSTELRHFIALLIS